MTKPTINFTRRTGGLGRLGADERKYAAICMNGVAAGDAELNTVYELNNLNDAVGLGIDAAYDADNLVLCYYHISEFFRMCPGGKLFIMLVSQTVTLTQMADKDTTYGLAKLLRDPKCKGKVRQAAVIRNPVDSYTPTIADGIDVDCIAVSGSTYSGAVVKAQALAVEENELKRPVQIFVEARSIEGSTADLIDATGALCPKVCLVALQDTVVGAAEDIYNGHAAVGTVLGKSCYIGISKSLANPGEGNPGIGNIQDAAEAKFIYPGISSNAVLSDYTDTASGDQDVIYDKGFIIPVTHTGYSGVYLNSDRTCDLETSDFARRANNLVVNEWERTVYAVMIPKLDLAVLVKPATGYLDPIVTMSLTAQIDAAVNKALSPADGQKDVSSAESYINPAQDILSTETVNVEGTIVPLGYAKTINVKVGFKNPFGA